jgi:glutamate/tyrosine decarboxylase-like PLP-dependent enzyme
MTESVKPPGPVQTPRRASARAAWDRRLRRTLALGGSGSGAPEAYFLGPKAENLELLRELLGAALDSHVAFRREFHPEDPSHLTEAVCAAPGFGEGVARLRRETAHLLDALRQSAPFASLRYQGHMLWDQALPAIVGQFAGMLYNQNNVAAEASPITTRLEIEVGNDLCRMLGYAVAPDEPEAAASGLYGWGHITSGGSVANTEALWAARNLTFAAVGLRAAIREVPALAPARALEVTLWDGARARLIELDTWTLLNLDLDEVAALPARIASLGIPVEATARALAGYAVQNTGLVGFYRSFMHDVPEPPVLLAPATCHYSWPKAATLCGLGQNALLVQRVDSDARLDLEHVETTLAELTRRRVPVICAVAVIGSTEESAVDPIAGLLALRRTMRARGLNFSIHADAAWGGYFRAMLDDAPEGGDASDAIPSLPLSPYVRAQYLALPEADSITVDPHKGGYVPYPAGAVCYRNAATRDAISLRAPVVFHGQSEPSVGVYGVEGSRPGSAAASVWLAHRVIRPDRHGYGRLLGQCMWTSKRFYCRLFTLDDPRVSVTLFNRSPAERNHAGVEARAHERETITEMAALGNAALASRLAEDDAARDLFAQLGSDQVILAFALNFFTSDGLNRDLARANAFNERVFHLCSVIEPRGDLNEVELILTSSRFEADVYGRGFVETFCRRLGVEPEADRGVDFLISTTMDPWLTDAGEGDFLGVLTEALRRAAHRALDELGF